LNPETPLATTSRPLTDRIEALLFVSESPVTAEELSEALQTPLHVIEEEIERIARRLSASGPLQLVRIAGGYQFSTKTEFADDVSRFLKPQRPRLGRGLMEVLAVVAYRQPVTSAEIEAVRGVDSAYAVRQLVDRRLITEVGRKAAPGRPVLYGTTQQFLHTFSLNSLEELPPIDQLPGVLENAAQPSLLDYTEESS
jgi:segregation and condensation protein B